MEIISVGGQHFPTFRPAYREIYYTDRKTGGGAIQDGLTHSLNFGEWLVGNITRIAVDAEHKLLEGVDVEDTVHVLTRHEPPGSDQPDRPRPDRARPDQVMGCFCMNQHQSPNESCVTVNCEMGTLRWEPYKNSWRWMDKPISGWHVEPAIIQERDDQFVRQENSFLDVLEEKQPPLCSLEEGIQTLRVNLAALKSADNQGVWQDVQHILPR